ncbi:MAG: hypothetical protein IJY12_04165, partial [Clostridia bacterium]|nr:hypothetical protein [Clostridia bacterium]
DSFPNFIAIDYTSSMETSSTITSVTFYFDGIETVYDHCTDHDYFYDYLWIEGTPYVAPERDLSLRIHYTHNGFSLPAVDYFGTTAVTGLRDANGNVIEDTQNYHVQAGDTLDITLHDGFKTSATFVRDDLDTATNSNEARPTSFSNTVGTMNVIVVPVYWRDQTDRRSDANLEAIYRALGNVIDANGNVTVYTPADPSEPSLSQYYQTASYGKLTVNAFVTEWYSIDATYDEMRDRDPQFDSYDVYQWLYSTYPDMDFSRFDSDRDGILDEVIFINTGDMSGYDSYERFSFAGAFRTVIAYGGYEQPGAGAGLARPVIHHYVNLNLGFLFENMIIGEPANVETSTLIHEFGHTLGLGDYYDTGSKGVSFLGGYDMMDRDVGDWNVYSKYTAGWITPTVVNLNGQASATYTIRSSAIHGDALLIYANGYNYNGTPFDEYLMVDLFTAQGLHEKDSALYNLENSVGVRIYHVNRRMEKSYVDTLDGSVACGRDIFSNDSDNSWNELCGFSELEIIPADGNGFTNRAFTEDCLFVAGDSFRTESYSDFFYNGKMDNGMSLGYEISVTSIDQVNGEYVATITVTAVGN